MSKCRMGCGNEAERGEFYCSSCIARWNREAENRRRKGAESKQSNEIKKLHKRIEVLEQKVVNLFFFCIK